MTLRYTSKTVRTLIFIASCIALAGCAAQVHMVSGKTTLAETSKILGIPAENEPARGGAMKFRWVLTAFHGVSETGQQIYEPRTFLDAEFGPDWLLMRWRLVNDTALPLASPTGFGSGTGEVSFGGRPDYRPTATVKPVNPFLFAISSGDLDKVKAMIGANPPLAASADDMGNSALHCAALCASRQGPAGYNHLAIMKLLLANGADVNTKSYYGETPLWAAASLGDVDAAELLLAKGADPNVRDFMGETPLFWANAHQHPYVADVLRRHGAHE